MMLFIVKFKCMADHTLEINLIIFSLFCRVGLLVFTVILTVGQLILAIGG